MPSATTEIGGAGKAGPASSVSAAQVSAQRGTTVLSDRAVGRVAAQAAQEALSPYAHTAARATADVRRGAARVAVEIDLPYPVDLDAVCRQVRQHVTERAGALTGLRVVVVDVLVGRLTPVRAHSSERVE
ncbi:hypothetical protein [Streptomyces fuscigenes]|uniref:hypothetical protein n=1 Tax=Streptomyces fuscigenes TaxID=1528880 RepID=UPI001F345F90|nr:hypothetical protein [Streptomyces fuscigenes]MCF3960550.1 hypothetical protein [Streptomyces fuscigenes]